MADTRAILFLSPGTDGGGIEIVIGADGKLHVVHVPPWNPDLIAEVDLAVTVFSQAARIKDSQVRQQFEQVATHVLQNRGKEIQTVLNRAGG